MITNTNLKGMYDAAQAAEAAKQSVAQEINGLFEAGRNEEAIALRPKLDAARTAAHEANQLYLSMRDAAQSGEGEGEGARRFVPMGGEPEPKAIKDMRGSDEYAARFWDAMRNGVTPKSIQTGQHSAERYGILLNAISETGGSPAGSEGGFAAPIDFDNKIIERQRQFLDLADGSADMANVENVSSNTGWRVIETAAAALPFDTLTELEVLGDEDETESPTFEKITFSLVDKGGFLRLSDDALQDAPVLAGYIARWFGRKSILTKNAAVLALLNAISVTTAVTDPAVLADAIKAVLNVTLDPDVAASAIVLCNQTGFNLLDQQKDTTERPLMQPDPTNATAKRLFGRRVVMLADRLWPNITSPSTLARFAIGSLPETITFFQRMPYQFATTNIGGSSWRSNSSEARAVMRIDAKVVDSGAMALITSTLTAGS